MENETTLFSAIYDIFETKITDDMYMEFTKEETTSMEHELLINAIPYFEFCRKSLDYNDEEGHFNSSLSLEEINIITTYMIVEWLGRQLASVENTRMKYSGSDFKFTSQANHMSKILALKQDYERLGFHFQRLYSRHRKDENGVMRSTFGDIMEPPAYKKGGFNK
jgi:hypothetical protein